MLLYKYVESLFEAQKEIVDSFLEDPVEPQEEEEEISGPQYERNLALLPPGYPRPGCRNSLLLARTQIRRHDLPTLAMVHGLDHC